MNDETPRPAPPPQPPSGPTELDAPSTNARPDTTPAADAVIVAPPPPRLPAGPGLWALLAAGVGVLALGAWLVSALLPDLLTRPDSGAPAQSAPAATVEETRRIQAALFYVSADGMTLTPVSREVPYGATPAEQARRILEVQVGAPPEGHFTAIPTGTTVRAVYLSDRGEAYVDLGGAIVSGHSGGSLDEALTVYAIVNALAANLPDISSVQILVEGQEVDTLVGHLDLRHPLGRALDLIRKGT